MQVEAIYKDGRVELLEPLRLKHNNVRVFVTIPAGELQDDDAEETLDLSDYNLSPEEIAAARQLRSKMDAIRNAPLPSDHELPELTEKQRERIAAFELRAQVRREQGRPT